MQLLLRYFPLHKMKKQLNFGYMNSIIFIRVSNNNNELLELLM
jgi:hypothetical protein